MSDFSESHLQIGGVEILLRCNRADVIAALVARWHGYESSREKPDVIHTFTCRADYQSRGKAARPYPGFDCTALGPNIYEFLRDDAHGRAELPKNLDEPIISVFDGVSVEMTTPVIESTLRVAMSLALPRKGGLMLHSAGVAAQGRAFIFTGQSGAGKSTIFRLLSASERVSYPLGDETTILRPDPEARDNETPACIAVNSSPWKAYATPFGGECGPVDNASAPLAGLYFLKQGKKHEATPMPRERAVRGLLRNMVAYVDERQAAMRALSSVIDCLDSVPAYSLEFLKDPGVVNVLGIT